MVLFVLFFFKLCWPRVFLVAKFYALDITLKYFFKW